MANKYDPPSMKTGAAAVEREMENFDRFRQQMDQIVAGMSSSAWDDATNQRFVRRYNNEAKHAAEKLSKSMKEFAAVLKQCARLYGNAIDQGNSQLSV